MHTTTSYIHLKSFRFLSTDVLSSTIFIISLFVHQANMCKFFPRLIICEGMLEREKKKFQKRSVPHQGYYLLYYKRCRLYTVCIHSRSYFLFLWFHLQVYYTQLNILSRLQFTYLML